MGKKNDIWKGRKVERRRIKDRYRNIIRINKKKVK